MQDLNGEFGQCELSVLVERCPETTFQTIEFPLSVSQARELLSGGRCSFEEDFQCFLMKNFSKNGEIV